MRCASCVGRQRLEGLDRVLAQHLAERAARRHLRHPQREAAVVRFLQQQLLAAREGVGQGIAHGRVLRAVRAPVDGSAVGGSAPLSGPRRQRRVGRRQRRRDQARALDAARRVAADGRRAAAAGPALRSRRCSNDVVGRAACSAAWRAWSRSGRARAASLVPLSRTTTGRRNTIRLVFLRAARLALEQVAEHRDVARPAAPSPVLSEYSSCSRPPSTMMLPSSTSTFDSIDALVGGRAVERCSRSTAWTLETSWKIVSLTVPFSLICGRTRSVRPTSLRSMVWNGLTVLLAAAGVGELAGDEGHVLADHDLGFLVVQRQQVGRGQHVAVAVAFEEAGQEAQHVLAVVVGGRCRS